MITYTVHAPLPINNEPVEKKPENYDRHIFIPEGFNWGFFFFDSLYLLVRGMWLNLFIWLVSSFIVYAVITSQVLNINSASASLVFFLFRTWYAGIIWEFDRFRFSRKGWIITDVVVADSYLDAEKIYFKTI